MNVHQIKADIRLIPSKVFACSHSLRFPRVMEVKWDHPWADVLTHSALEDLVSGAKVDADNAKYGTK
jgi:hypothetical protein